MRRLPLACLLAFLPVLGACGGDDATAPLPADVDGVVTRLLEARGPALEQVAEEVGVRAQEDPALLERLVELLRAEEPNPGMVTLMFELAEPETLAEGAARNAALDEAVRVMAYRLRANGHPPGTFDMRDGGTRVELRVPKPPFSPDLDAETRAERDETYGRALLRHLTAPGRVELLLVVPAPEEGLDPPSPWTGTREAFDRFVETQAAAIDAAVEAGRVHAPGAPGFVLCAVPPAAGEQAHGYIVVLRSPSEAEHFDRDDLAFRPIEFLDTQEIGVEMRVNPERSEALKAWSIAHRGQEAVLVVNGVAGTPLRLREPIDGPVLVPFGAGDDPGAQARRQALLRTLATRAHPHPIRGHRVTRVDPNLVTPAALALVASGNAGAKRMGALRREGGDIGARAARILELIGRRRTSGGERFVPGNK